MSNGESKIAIFKAALCCGFAIALRALFLGILPYSPSFAERVRGWVVMLRRSRNISSLREALASWQSTVYEARIMGILCRSIATLTLAMTIGKKSLRFQIKPNQILTSTLGLLGYTRGLLILRILLLRESESLFAFSSADFDSGLDSTLESSL